MSASGLQKRQKKSSLIEVCSVRVGVGWYGVPIRHILEIIGGARPQAVPLAPDFVGGLVHYRGEVLTTVSMRWLLGLPAREGAYDILVIESMSGCFGLLVDAVGEVLTLSSADYEPNPSTLDQRQKALFAGAYKLKDKLLTMLDVERVDPLRLGQVSAA